MPKKNEVFRSLNDQAHLFVANKLKNGSRVSSPEEVKELYNGAIDRIYEKSLGTEKLTQS